ncbi:MAG: murein biosynthesis integral membrane protein MurJ [Longimicrobiales bacterium]|nr:murein biosynthesis integral membrane protein MurJ [Longimicrobiales bacterium]
MTTRDSPPPTPGRRRGAAWWVGMGILFSRLSGLVRDAALAYYLGSTRVAEVIAAGLRTPNIIQNLLGEGTLSASFIPIYARMLEDGREEEAGRFAGAVLGIIATLAFAIAALGIVCAPLIAALFVEWDPASRALLTRVLRIFFPMTATLVLSAWALGILNSHRRFFLAYVAPVLWNLTIIIALVVAGRAFVSGRIDPDAVAIAFAWGGLVGAALQLLVQLPTVTRLLRGFRLSLGRGVTGVREAIRSFGPVVAARGVVNLSAWVDLLLAALLVQGAVIHLTRAQTLYVLPISLFGMAIAASELPELARSSSVEPGALAPRVRGALRRARFLLIPSAVAYLVFGDVLVAALLQRGDFGTSDTTVVGYVLAAYALGLPASGSSRTLSSAFYALDDTRTPARVATLRVGVSLALGASLMFPFDRIRVGAFGVGAAGLALGSAVAAWLEYGLLRRALRERIGGHAPGLGGLLRVVVASSAGAGVAVGVRIGLAAAEVGSVTLAVGTAGAFGVVYLLAAALLGEGIPLRPGRA